MNNYRIIDVIPHREPMILIDSLCGYDDDSCTCQLTIKESSAFYDKAKSGVASYIGSEYMAQTIAAYAGAHALDNQQEIAIGFLLGSRKYKTFVPYFKLNSVITIKVKQLYQEDSGLRVFDCEVSDEQQVIAQANINVFQPQDAQAFLKDSYEQE